MTYAKKSLGQNFLMHARIAERIADTAQLSSKDTVLEVGPGTGMLTRALLARAGRVIAVEADGELFTQLQETFAAEISAKKLELIHGDIRTYDLSSVLPKKKGFHIVANIPYYITGELFRQFLSAEHQPISMTLLVQKEVAVRIARDKKASILSLSVRVYGEPKYEFTVPRGAFKPAPNVDSAVLRISGISRKNFDSKKQENRFFELVKAGFAHKRKFVRSNLAEASLSAGEIPEKARAEDLKLEDWLELAKNVGN